VIDQLQLRVRGFVFDALAAGPPGGEPVLLLHGFPQTAACWTPLLAPLAAAGYRAVAPNQRGYSPGARPRRVGAYRLPELVADVAAVADRLGGDRVHLVGHDWGGVVAWSLAGQDPARVATLTAVSTPHPEAFGRALLRGGQCLRSAYIAFLRAPRLPELVLGIRGRRGLRLLLDRSGLGPAWVEAYSRAMGQPGALAAALAWYRAATPLDLRVPPVQVPTLYLWGSRDPALGPRAATTTGRWAAGAYRFEVLTGAGHWLPEHHPDALASHLLEHLRAGVHPGRAGGRPADAGRDRDGPPGAAAWARSSQRSRSSGVMGRPR
jgi:pimeloyl-ACP methyl ester carboxylesterase